MYKVIYAIIVTIASFLGLRAQEFQGMAVYESKSSTSDFKTRMEGNKDMTPDMQK
ncbi:GLPGLI family protein, partial [Flavobacterium franklandianum]